MALDDSDLEKLTGMTDDDVLLQATDEVKQGLGEEDLEFPIPELGGDVVAVAGPKQGKLPLVTVQGNQIPRASIRKIRDDLDEADDKIPVGTDTGKKLSETGKLKLEKNPLEGKEIAKIKPREEVIDRRTPPVAKIDDASKELNDVIEGVEAPKVVVTPSLKRFEVTKEFDISSGRPVRVHEFNLIDNEENNFKHPNENYLSRYDIPSGMSPTRYLFDTDLSRFISRMSFGRYISGIMGLRRELGVRLTGEMRLLDGYYPVGDNNLLILTVCADSPGKPMDPKEAIVIVVDPAEVN